MASTTTDGCLLWITTFFATISSSRQHIAMASFMKHAGLLAAAVVTANAQFVPAPTDLTSTTGFGYPVRYKEVPDGICEMTPGVKSYSGYVDTDEHQHIFWWFFEARNEEPSEAPLTVG